MLINDRLSTFLTQHAGEMAFVQRSHNVIRLQYRIIVVCNLTQTDAITHYQSTQP